MNLTSSFYSHWLTLILSCGLLGEIFAQSNVSPELPEQARVFLADPIKPNSTTTQEFLLPTSLATEEDSIQILRKLDGWVIARVGQKSKVVNSRSCFSVNHLWKLSHLELLNLTGAFQVTLKYNDQTVLSLFPPRLIIYNRNPFVRLWVDSEVIKKLITDPNILYIGKESSEVYVESRVLDLNLIPNNVTKIHVEYPQLNGSTIAVGIKEDLFDVEDFDYLGRGVTSKWASESISDHATEMATIIGGAGVTFVNGKGVASQVTMYSSSFDQLIPDVKDFYLDEQILVQNHSYGGVVESFYGASAEAYDQISNEIPELLHVMSSGNSGLEVPSEGTYASLGTWGNLTGNYKNAKNNLVVGAVDTTGVLLPFSSVGPAADGRVKPELVAYSTVGTSNATALTSGVVALMQERFQEKYTVPAPSDLIKSLLINGATDVGNKGVDFKTGYGNVNAYASLKMLEEGKFYMGSVERGKSETVTLEIPRNAMKLKVTLVWNDPAGQANDVRPLVNDLDLKLTDPNVESWLPWVLDHGASEASLETLAKRGEDHLNNVEQVSIEIPVEGTYQISVEGKGLTTDMQSFGLAFSYQLKDVFEWEYPLKDSNMPYDGETGSYFRWINTFEITHGDLYLTMDDGNSWMLLDENIDLSSGFFRWSPVGLNGVARAKIKMGSQEFETNDFIVSSTLLVNSGFHCADSSMIYWFPQEDVKSYDLLQFADGEFELMHSASDTFEILSGEDLKNGYFKVIPKFSEHKQGIGSYLFNTQEIGADCFLTSFFGYKNEDGVLLSTKLTSLYGVESVSIENLHDGSFQELHNYSLGVEPLLEYQDLSPYEGVNSYRARVSFDNGAILISDTVQLIYLNERTALLYPNPVQYGTELALQTNSSNGQSSVLYIFDLQGNQVAKGELSELEYLPINGNLIPGVYVYIVENEKGSTRGKLVIY